MPLLWMHPQSHHACHPWLPSCSTNRRNASHTWSLHPTTELCSNTSGCTTLLQSQQHDSSHPLWHILLIWNQSTVAHRRIFLHVIEQPHPHHQWSHACALQHHAINFGIHNQGWSWSTVSWQNALHHTQKHGHPQPATPIQTDNKVTEGIVNNHVNSGDQKQSTCNFTGFAIVSTRATSKSTGRKAPKT